MVYVSQEFYQLTHSLGQQAKMLCSLLEKCFYSKWNQSSAGWNPVQLKWTASPYVFAAIFTAARKTKEFAELMLSSLVARWAATIVLHQLLRAAFSFTCSSDMFAHVQQLPVTADLLGLPMPAHESLLIVFLLCVFFPNSVPNWRWWECYCLLKQN